MQVHYPDKLRLRVPRGLPAALQEVARQHNTTPSELARRALLKVLEAEGLALRDGRIEPKHADTRV
jgi:hypothetical protein